MNPPVFASSGVAATMETKIFGGTIDWMQAYSLALDIICGCWVLFITVWLLAAVATKRTVYRESQTQRLRYWVLLVMAWLLLLYGRDLPYPLNLRIILRAT